MNCRNAKTTGLFTFFEGQTMPAVQQSAEEMPRKGYTDTDRKRFQPCGCFLERVAYGQMLGAMAFAFAAFYTKSGAMGILAEYGGTG
jgi:hypothetical protein